MNKGALPVEIYESRHMTDLYPGLAELEVSNTQARQAPPAGHGPDTLEYIRRLRPLTGQGEPILVVGCGPKPDTVTFLPCKRLQLPGR